MRPTIFYITALVGYCRARFSQEQNPIPQISSVNGGEPGQAQTLAGEAISDLLGGANACNKLVRADQILDELGPGADAVAAAKGMVAAEKNFNNFTSKLPTICSDASLPKNAVLRGIIPKIDPGVEGAAAVNAQSELTLAQPLQAEGKSIADLLNGLGFTNFIPQSASGDPARGTAASSSKTEQKSGGEKANSPAQPPSNSEGTNPPTAAIPTPPDLNAGASIPSAPTGVSTCICPPAPGVPPPSPPPPGIPPTVAPPAALPPPASNSSGSASEPGKKDSKKDGNTGNPMDGKQKADAMGTGANGQNQRPPQKGNGNMGQEGTKMGDATQGTNTGKSSGQVEGNDNGTKGQTDPSGNSANQGDDNQKAGNQNGSNKDSNNRAGGSSGVASFGSCDPTISFEGGRGNRPATEFTFQSNDPVIAADQQEALNPNIITNRICDELTNICDANAAAKTLCLDAKAQIQGLGTRDQSTADAWNQLLGSGGGSRNNTRSRLMRERRVERGHRI